MSADPRPHTSQLADGTSDLDTERRFQVLFNDLRPFTTARPTDLASTLLLLQELWDRQNVRT